MANSAKVIGDAREFLAKSTVGSVTATELDGAVSLIRRMLEAMESQPKPESEGWRAKQDASARKCGCASCLKWLQGAANIGASGVGEPPKFANDEYLGKISVRDNSRTMNDLGSWRADDGGTQR